MKIASPTYIQSSLVQQLLIIFLLTREYEVRERISHTTLSGNILIFAHRHAVSYL